MKMRTYSEAEEKETNCEILAGKENSGENREAQNIKGQEMEATREEADVRPQNNKSRTRGKRRYGDTATRGQR